MISACAQDDTLRTTEQRAASTTGRNKSAGVQLQPTETVARWNLISIAMRRDHWTCGKVLGVQHAACNSFCAGPQNRWGGGYFTDRNHQIPPCSLQTKTVSEHLTSDSTAHSLEYSRVYTDWREVLASAQLAGHSSRAGAGYFGTSGDKVKLRAMSWQLLLESTLLSRKRANHPLVCHTGLALRILEGG